MFVPPPISMATANPTDILNQMTAPARLLASRRNAFLDWLFYDTGNLSATELSTLLAEANVEGSILVVWPSGEKGDLSIRKFADYESLRAAPGRLLDRFTIAGVGSSDVGAAAFARTVADHFGGPVGAIVAGYGIADLLSEAVGGWFVLGSANRLLQSFLETAETVPTSDATQTLHNGRLPAKAAVSGRTDTETLVNLLNDADRTVKSVAGHSKGCLSIAYAVENIAALSQPDTVKKAQAARIITAGAVVALPAGFENVGQYIGAIDWFGGLNSRRGVDHVKVPNAWHHLNTTLPSHLDFGSVLAQEAG